LKLHELSLLRTPATHYKIYLRVMACGNVIAFGCLQIKYIFYNAWWTFQAFRNFFLFSANLLLFCRKDVNLYPVVIMLSALYNRKGFPKPS